MDLSKAVDSATLAEPPLGKRARVEGRLIEILDRLPTAHHTMELVQLTRSIAGTKSELPPVLQGDPSLVFQVLRRVNSDYYGLDYTVRDLPTALRLVGLPELLNLALTVRLRQLFEPDTELGHDCFEKLWEHCLAVASAGRLVARICGNVDPGDAYLAGLLHDVGLLIMLRQQPQLIQLLRQGIRQKRPTCEVEEQIYEFNHTQLGARAARSWGFAPRIVDVIRFHHEPEHATGQHATLAYVACVANYLASRSGWPALGVHNAAIPPDCTYNLLELDTVAFRIICEELMGTLEKSGSLA